MKLKSLLLGTVAAAGLTSGAYAADLGVVLTALNVCDSLGISGLTISSDSNCLAISGGVSYEAKWGDYAGSTTYVTSSAGTYTVEDDDALATDGLSSVEAWLKFAGSADSSFGQAMAVIMFEYTDAYTVTNGVGTGTPALGISDAYVSVGDSTMLIAGKTDSIANTDQDEPYNYIGLFRSEIVDAGVTTAGMPGTGGHVIQVVSDLGNGVDVGLGLEALNSADPTVVGVMNYAGDTFSAHATGLYGINSATFGIHVGAEGSFDMISVLGAAAFDSASNWNVLGSMEATFDMFTVALSGEAANGLVANTVEFGVGGSVSAAVTDGITLNLGSRYFDADNTAALTETWEVRGQIVAALTETITASGSVGYITTNVPVASDTIYFEGELAWSPGGGFDAAVNGGGNDDGAYWVGFTASKDFE